MKKAFHIFFYEYWRHVRRKRFLFTLLSMPVLIMIAVSVGWFVESLDFDDSPFGYVDHSGVLSPNAEERFEGESSLRNAVDMILYDEEMQALSALQTGEIQAYYVVGEKYLENGQVELVSVDAPAENVRDQFKNFLKVNLLANQPDGIAHRLLEGNHITVQSSDGKRQTGEGQIWNLFLPIFAGLLFIMAVNTGSGYLLQAVVEEKENRTIEIMISSVSPGQLMAGKIFGNICVGLTLLLVWLLFTWGSYCLARHFFFPGFSLQLESGVIGLMLFSLLPAFVLVASLMAAIGATVTEIREAQQVSGFFSLLVVLPFWFSSQLFLEPNGVLAVILSIFPITAPVALAFRALSTAIPLWQLVLSFALLYGSAAGAIWLAARAFRTGMLVYGRRLKLSDVVRRG